MSYEEFIQKVEEAKENYNWEKEDPNSEEYGQKLIIEIASIIDEWCEGDLPMESCIKDAIEYIFD